MRIGGKREEDMDGGPASRRAVYADAVIGTGTSSTTDHPATTLGIYRRHLLHTVGMGYTGRRSFGFDETVETLRTIGSGARM